MKTNVRKVCLPLLSQSDYEVLLSEMDWLHNSLSTEELNERIVEWKKDWVGEHQVYKYICNQWLQGRWTNWQIFHTPPGYANTNSNIESFNAQIKNFTQYKKKVFSGWWKRLKV